MNRNDKQVDNEIIIYHPAIKHFCPDLFDVQSYQKLYNRNLIAIAQYQLMHYVQTRVSHSILFSIFKYLIKHDTISSIKARD